MSDGHKTKSEAQREIEELRRRLAGLEAGGGDLQTIADGPQTDHALRHGEAEYRGLVEACPDAVVMTDLNGRTLFASRSTWKLVGLAESDELVGRSVFDFIIPEDRPRLAANMANLVQAGLRFSTEYTVLRRDGGTVAAEASSSVIRDADGRPRAVMAVIRDITERKKAEESLQREHRTLRHLLQSSDHERQLIAYEIHDGLAQQLAGAMMQFQIFDHLKNVQPKEAAKAYEAGMTMLQQSHFEARRLISGVRPPILDEAGVVAAVAHLVNDRRQRRGPKIEFHSRVEFDRLVPVLENAVYRITQEGLTNACRHSRSKCVRVELLQDGDRLTSRFATGASASTPMKSATRVSGSRGFVSESGFSTGGLNWKPSPAKARASTSNCPSF